MRKIAFLFLITLFLFCNKKVDLVPSGQNYYVEDFRKTGMTDYETLMAACDSIPDYSNLIFTNKTYIFNHTPIIYKAINFYGPAVLKREDQITYTLKEAANESSSFLVLNNTAGIIPGDRIFVTFGPADINNTGVDVVNRVSGDSLFLGNNIGSTGDSATSFPSGTTLFKNIIFFWIVGSDSYPFVGCTFTNLVFDGNRDNNTGSKSWRTNSAILAVTKNTTKYRYCIFINSPAETIVGHNADIRYCKFYNLNGSAFHTSADRVTWSEDEIHSYFSDNVIENSNEIPNSVGGHSEGAITHSNSGGYYTATRNSFTNVGEAVLGELYPSVSIHDWGTSNITFTGNVINGAGKIARSVALIPGVLHDIKIDSNTISNMPSFDWSSVLAHWPDIILKDKNGQ